MDTLNNKTEEDKRGIFYILFLRTEENQNYNQNVYDCDCNTYVIF